MQGSIYRPYPVLVSIHASPPERSTLKHADRSAPSVPTEVSVKSLEAVTDPSYIPFGQRFFETGENLSPICKPLDITPEDLAKRNGNG